MTAAAEMYAVLHGLGISLRLEEGDLKVRAPKGVMTAALQQAIREHKVGLMALAQTHAPPDALIEAFEERAAIMEYDGGLCRDEAERLAGARWNNLSHTPEHEGGESRPDNGMSQRGDSHEAHIRNVGLPGSPYPRCPKSGFHNWLPVGTVRLCTHCNAKEA